MASKVRDTDIAKYLEYFLDENELDLSYNMMQALEAVADDVDREAYNKEVEISELKREIEDLNEKIEELEKDLAETGA